MTDVLFNRQFAQQEVLRTITLGLSPFIPFTQQYVMKMKAERENVQMMPDPPMDGVAQDPAWTKRKQEYFAQQSPKEVEGKAPRTDITETSRLLKQLFDEDVGNSLPARKFDESVVGEILSSVGEREINKMLDELGTPIQKGIDGSPLFNQPAVGGQGFDRLMTDGLRTVVSKALGGRDMSNVVAIEETESKFAKEVQENLKGLSGTEAIEQLNKNVSQTYGGINKMLEKFKVDSATQLKGALEMAREDPVNSGAAYTKQVLARAIDLVNARLGDKEYMYTVPVGNTGMAATIFLKTTIKNKSPHISHELNVVKTGGDGRLIELMGTGLSAINAEAGEGFMKQIGAMDLVAMNEAVLTADRVGYVGMMQEVQLSTMMDVGADISMTKNKGKGVTGLSSKAMADSLTAQMDAALKDKSVQNKFTRVYVDLIARANRASDLWKTKVDPPIDFMGARGVWKMTGPNWRDNRGEDFSISPFLMIRRKGVAAFKPKNEAKFL